MGRNPNPKQRLKSLFIFSKSERRGILWLLPLLTVLAVMIVFANRPRFEKSFLEQVTEDTEIQERSQDIGGSSAVGVAKVNISEMTETGVELFAFDPNIATLQEFCRLGFTQRTAAGIIKYRERGKRFEIPEDFATCYGVSLEKYTRLEPYIVIGEEYRAKSRYSEKQDAGYGSARQRTVDRYALSDFDPNELDSAGFVGLGFSEAQAATIIKYRESLGGFRTIDDFARSYVISEDMMKRLHPYIDIKRDPSSTESNSGGDVGAVRQRTSDSEIMADNAGRFKPIDLNAADSAQLRSVKGIGEATVVRIMNYRERLGGFARKEQLSEIPGITQENYKRICEQIFVDSCVIQKIDINFATQQGVVDALGNHPYMTANGLRKLLKNRQLKGGWRSIEDMESENILTKSQANKLAPYLIFNE